MSDLKPISEYPGGLSPVSEIPEGLKPISEYPVQPAAIDDDELWVNNILSRRTQNVKDMVGRNAVDNLPIPFTDKEIPGSVANIPKMAALATGEAAGAAVEILGETVARGAAEVTPEPVKTFAKEKAAQIIDTPVGRAGLMALQKGQQFWDEFKSAHPDEAMGLEGIINLSAFGIVGRGSQEVVDVAADLVKKAPKNIEKKIGIEVGQGMTKGVRPTVAGKKAHSQYEAYERKAKDAIEAIIENKNDLQLLDDAGEVVTGQLPQNLRQFAQAIEQTRQKLYQQYTALAEGTEGTVKTTNIVNELRKFAADPKKQVSGSEGAEYAAKVADRLESIGDLNPIEAQDAIRDFNAKLEAFYKNPNADATSRHGINAKVVELLRENLDDLITSATGEKYSALKKQYGSLKAIEKDVAQRMIVDLRKNTKGLVDFSDIATSAQAVYALVNKNPALFLASATAKGMAKYIKQTNDPNRAIKKMFENVESLKSGSDPKSLTMQQLEKISKTRTELNKAKEPINPLRGADLRSFGEQY